MPSKQTATNYTPQALLDSVEALAANENPATIPSRWLEDYQRVASFLLSYKNNAETFKSFRRELERFVQYCWFVAKKDTTAMSREAIEDYLVFCQKPPAHWIGRKQVARFRVKDGQKQPHPEWRPFLVTISKADRQAGKVPRRNHYQLSEKGFREIFTVLNCYYNFLIQEEHTDLNPILRIKQKNRFYRSHQSQPKIRRISREQWHVIMNTAQQLAARKPAVHERTLFMLALLYGLYLRISELTANARWSPSMHDFEKDHDGHWWFTTVGKGNKERKIAVSPDVLEALKRWRTYLKCSPTLPLPSDNSPLLPKQRGQGGMRDSRHIRQLIQVVFNEATHTLAQQGDTHEAEALAQATVHWLRHTGISEDVKTRPREHVRDDAGHSSSSITDKYIDITLRERYASAQQKTLAPLADDAQPSPAASAGNKSFRPSDKVNVKKRRTTTLTLWLRVENNSSHVRGKKRARQDIEDRVLRDYGMRKLEKDGWEYELTLPYPSKKALKETVYQLLDEAESIAEARYCFTEYDIFDGPPGIDW